MSPSAATRVEWARRLAQALVSGGYATEPAVNAVLEESSSIGASFTSLLIERGVAAADIVVGVLSQMTQLHVVDLNRQTPSAEALQLTLVAIVARQYGAIGYQLHGEQLVMAFGDAPDADDVRALSALVGREVLPVLADPMAVERIWWLARDRAAARVRTGAAPVASTASGSDRAGRVTTMATSSVCRRCR